MSFFRRPLSVRSPSKLTHAFDPIGYLEGTCLQEDPMVPNQVMMPAEESKSIAPSVTPMTSHQSVAPVQPAEHHIKQDRICLPPAYYDMALGGLHGTLQAVATGLILNPVDKLHAQISVNQWHVSAFAKFLEQPFKGIGYNIKTSIPRNCLVFTSLPIARDLLKDQGFSPATSKALSGVVAGIVEAGLTSKNTAVKITGWTSKSADFHGAWNKLTPTQKWEAQMAAFRWGAVRGGVYWAIMPGLANVINKELKNLNHPHSYILKELDVAISGASSSMLAALVSYPFDVAQKRQIAMPHEPIVKPLGNCLIRNGLWKTIAEHTHKGASLALARMGFSGMLWNLTLAAAETGVRSAFKKDVAHDGCEDHRQHQPKMK